MTPESEDDLRLEIGHVLFIDIVGYSKLMIDEQRERLHRLTEIVLATPQVDKSTDEQLIKLPTGDGMALVFRHSSEEPIRCALQVAAALKHHPEIAVRMGVNSGPVSEVTDVSGRTNIAGPGINLAQRVMDCGDAGHILVSQRVAEDLIAYRHWSEQLHSLGDREVKHGVRVHVFNLCTDELGNPALPEKFRQAKEAHSVPDVSARQNEGFWIAVLPLKSASASTELKALADGLTEEIVAGLSRFSYLRVITHGSTQRYADHTPDVRVIGQELGARYVINGNLRQVGGRLRVAAQLVDAATGAQLWSETYERPFSVEAVFEIQDDLVPRIVSTVGDAHGILPHNMSESLRSKAPDQLTPYEAVLRSFGYGYRYTAEEHAAIRAGLESAVQKAPDYSDAWAMLSLIYEHEHSSGFNPQPDSLGRSLLAARRAIDTAHSSAMAHNALARVMFLRKEYQAFRVEADQAIALNPLNSPTLAGLGLMVSYAGEWERGCALVKRALQLNPRHPGWYWFALFFNAYRKGDYQDALNIALRFNLPDFFGTHEALAAAYGQLGKRAEAARSLQELLKLKPDYAATGRERLENYGAPPDLIDHVMDGLRKAGLEIGDKGGASAAVKAPDSGPVRADEGFWVAVLPFKYSGSNSDLTALTDGLTEEIVTGLSRFSYLKVIARSSTSRYARAAVDVRSAGKELGARYVMEGSLRQAGTKLRLLVQLVDAVSGAHLWAENYERAFTPDAVFELQDDLVPRIVSTVADMNGVLSRSLSDAVRSRTPEQLSPYEAVLRSFGYFARVNPEDLAVARAGLELAVQKAPAYADAWAMLALLCVQEHGQGFNLRADCLTKGLSAARRAVESGPANHLAYFSLAQALFFRKEFQAFRNAAERTVALNPMDGNSIAFVGELLIYAGEWERGLALAERAKQLNPNHPGWYWYANFYNSYRQRDYRSAITSLLNADLPGHWGMHAGLAAAYAQLGENDAAGKALRNLLNLRPDFAVVVRKEAEKWWNTEYVEHFLDGLRKAGLEIAGEDGRPGLPATPGKSSGKIFSQEAFWVAVLPFKSSGGVEIESFADGLNEDVTTGLSRFPYLSVVARAAAARLKGRAGDERTLGAELGARYVVEGSIRKQGSAIRVSAHLIDTETGAQLWAETYDRDLELSSIFAVQDDIAARIVATVADSYGVLVNSMASVAAAKDDADLTPAEWQFQYFAYRQQITPANHAALKKRLEAALEQDKTRAEIWSCLAQMYVDAYAFGFQADPTDLDRALDAARRGVEFDRTNQFGLVALAQTYFFRQDLAAFRPAAERAMAINPLNTDALGILGLLIVHTGEFERGAAIVRHAMELNPDHAGWMQFGPIWEHFHKGEYERALDHANRVDIPGLFWPYLVVAAANGHLGRKAEAAAAVCDLLAIDPEFAAHARSNIASWHFASGLLEPLLDGLRQAGLDLPAAEGDPASSPIR